MARALRLATRGLYTTDPNPRVGCVLAVDGEVVGEGWHRRAGGAHAEVKALMEAGSKALGSTAYVTLEPCCHQGKTPPCTQALVNAGVSKVISAMYDPNPKVARKGMGKLKSAGIEVACGLLEFEAQKLNRGFCKRMLTGKPFVFTKMAMSLDGRTALASGESKWITGASSRRDAHRLRARSGAIITGVGTVLADNPSLTARLENVDVVQPLRVIVDSTLRTPVTAKILSLPGNAVIAAAARGSKTGRLPDERRYEVVELPPTDDGRVSLDALIEYLADREINEIMVEAGTTLNGAMLQSGLIDEVVVYLAPCVLGDDGRGLFQLPEIKNMADKIALDLNEVRQVEADIRLRYSVKR